MCQSLSSAVLMPPESIKKLAHCHVETIKEVDFNSLGLCDEPLDTQLLNGLTDSSSFVKEGIIKIEYTGVDLTQAMEAQALNATQYCSTKGIIIVLPGTLKLGKIKESMSQTPNTLSLNDMHM